MEMSYIKESLAKLYSLIIDNKSELKTLRNNVIDIPGTEKQAFIGISAEGSIVIQIN